MIFPTQPGNLRRRCVRAGCATLASLATLLTQTTLADSAQLLSAQPSVWSPAEAVDRDRFGSSVDLNADRIAVGATAADGPADDAGAVYLMKRNGNDWQQTSVLRLEDVGAAAHFGSDVAFDGEWLAAGSPGVYAGAGAIYLFHHNDNDWQQQQRFLLPESQDFTFFGSTLDMEAGLLIAGAPGYDASANDSGIVMVYELGDNGNWIESGQMQTENPQEGERLGSAVALHGNRALVGADGAGVAYLFERRSSEWVQIARFSEEVGERGGLGASVALADGVAIVGAPFAEDTSGEARGAAFLYTEKDGSWELQTRLQSDTPNRSDEFGAAVAVSNGMAMVSSPRDDTAARDAGAVFVYAPGDGEWNLDGRLSLPDSSEYDEFGRSLALDVEAGAAAVGTPADAPPDTDDGYPGTVTTYRW
ncbi:MAG: FG-GAP repeat protein [Pseudomonadota bacterium]